MSDLSYLSELSNKELHKKCLEYGMPNIPVTESSRKVLLARLRSVILGTPLNKSKSAGAAKNTPTPRRETIHGSKVTPAAEISYVKRSVASKSPNRNNNNIIRQTIAAVPTYDSDVSMRTVTTTTTVSDVGSQSEEEDDFYVVNPLKSHGRQIPLERADQRQRRSVSLTKSGVLTTSYTREVGERDNNVDVPLSYTYERPRVENAHTLPYYEPSPTTERAFRPSYTSSPPAQSQRLTQTQLNSTSYLEQGDYNPHGPHNTYSGSAAPFGYGAAASSPSSLRQRQTLEGRKSGIPRGVLLTPTTKVNTLYPQLNQFFDNGSERPVELMDTDSESDAEVQLPARSVRRSPLARPQIGRSVAPKDTPTQHFRELINSLDNQYHIKRYFFILLLIMLITFMYVMLSPSA